MATYYADLDLVGTGGDGSIGNPWYAESFRSVVNGTLAAGSVIKTKGEVVYDGSSSINIKGSGNTAITIENWISAPWRINIANSFSVLYSTIRGGIVDAESEFINASDAAKIIDCHLITTDDLRIWTSDVRIKGCSIIAADIDGRGSSPSAEFDDSVILCNSFTDCANIVYNKCCFTAAVVPGVLNTCQVNWPAPSFPAWNAAQSAFSSLLLSVGINIPPQPGNPPYIDDGIDYSLGLWDSARRGIGAMDFPSVWKDTAPSEGFAAYDKDRDHILTFDGTNWNIVSAQVKTSAADSQAGYLVAKLEAGMALALSEDVTDPLDHKAKFDVQFGTLSDQACVGDDARLSDSRTPTVHDFAGALHQTSSIAAIQTKVSDGSLITTAAGEFPGITVKAAPIRADQMLIEDSADTQAKKSVEVGDLVPWLYGTGAPPATTGLVNGTLYIKYIP